MLRDQFKSAVLLFERQLWRQRLPSANGLHGYAVQFNGCGRCQGSGRLGTGNQNSASHEDCQLAYNTAKKFPLIAHLCSPECAGSTVATHQSTAELYSEFS